MIINVTILDQDLNLAQQAARFHLFHKYSKWYRVEIRNFKSASIFDRIEQQRHCLICHKIQRSDIETAPVRYL